MKDKVITPITHIPLKNLIQLALNTPNDSELGKKLRQLINNY